MRVIRGLAMASVVVLVSGCNCGDGSPLDAGTDSGMAQDSGSRDAGVDAGLDAGVDAGLDAGVDAGLDAGVDAGLDAGVLPCVMECAGVISPTTTLPSLGLVLWVRSDVGVNVAPSTQRVCGWCDLSGHGNHLTPLDLMHQTLLVPTATGGHPAVRWSGQESLQHSGVLGIGATSGRTVVVVATLDDRSVRSVPFYQGHVGTLGEWWGIDPNVFRTVGDRFGVYLTANSFDTATPTDVLPHQHVMTISTMTPGAVIAEAMTYHLDGSLQTLTTTAGNGLISSLANANITEIGFGGIPARMSISELLLYDRPLTATERQDVEQVMRARYSLPPPP
jgi:hypothetical protein